ncbi:MAG: hypothetical protein ACKVTZ_10725, partial [Bacteroidia bacterium]
PINPSEWLKETLIEGEEIAFFSEKARSEALIFPILMEIRKLNQRQIAIYSGADLQGDVTLGLNGECDFILSKGEQKEEIDIPLFCMIEAKDQDIKRAIPQCIAQMRGAQLFNEKHKKITPRMWGCVTTGTEWLFLKLEEKVAYIDKKRYYSNKIEEVLGIFQAIIQDF